MRKTIVAGNWKMNLSKSEALDLIKTIDTQLSDESPEVVVFSPAIYLDVLMQSSGNRVGVGAQNAYHQDAGAFTGEISMLQLKNLGVNNVLIGHSERRQLFNEDVELLKLKVDAAIRNDVRIFFCCGELLATRKENKQLEVVKQQLEASLFHLSSQDFEKTVIAYEPVWAIGTGLTASSEQAEEMHANIRLWIAERYGEQIANNYSILYGGSCNPSNAAALFACPNVDGGLIGGAALNSNDFSVLIATETWTISN